MQVWNRKDAAQHAVLHQCRKINTWKITAPRRASVTSHSQPGETPYTQFRAIYTLDPIEEPPIIHHSPTHRRISSERSPTFVAEVLAASNIADGILTAAPGRYFNYLSTYLAIPLQLYLPYPQPSTRSRGGPTTTRMLSLQEACIIHPRTIKTLQTTRLFSPPTR